MGSYCCRGEQEEEKPVFDIPSDSEEEEDVPRLPATAMIHNERMRLCMTCRLVYVPDQEFLMCAKCNQGTRTNYLRHSY